MGAHQAMNKKGSVDVYKGHPSHAPALHGLGDALLERISEAGFIADQKGNLIAANTRLCRWIGWGLDELLSMHSSDILHLAHSGSAAPPRRRRKLMIGEDLKCQLRRKDDSLISAVLSTSRLDSGEVLGLVGEDADDRKALDLASTRLAAIVESSDDAIIAKDFNGIVTDWNAGAEKLFGYTADEMIGQPITKIFPPDRLREEDGILARIRKGQRVDHFETVRQTKSKKLIDVSVTISPIKNDSGSIIGASKIARDISTAKAHEREITRMTRLYDALSQVNQAIVHAKNRDNLFASVCEVLVERGGFSMAWIGCHEQESHALIPVATYGDAFELTKKHEVAVDDSAEGGGPSGTAFKTGRHYICNDVASDAATKPWQDQLRLAGYQASAAFPILERGCVQGTLNVYVDQAGFFKDQEIALLDEAAQDISFALDSFVRDRERRNAESVAKNEAAFSNTMIESMPGIVYFYDSLGQLLRWNRNLEFMSGYSGDEIRKMHPGDFFTDDDKTEIERNMIEALERGNSSTEASLQAKDGGRTPVMLTVRRVEYNGTPCLVCMGFDISKRLQAEVALRHLNESLENQVAMRTRELQGALDKAMAADEVKSVFLATMSHELRTPLNSIIGFTGILLQGLAGELNQEQAKQLGMVQSSAEHLLDLINDVLDISKIEAGQLEIHPEDFDLFALLERTMAIVRPLADKKGLALSADISQAIHGMHSDRRRVEQIVINLLNNAIKFTERGSVILSAELIDNFRQAPYPEPIQVVRIQIADTGIGIDSENISTLFQPFRQLDAGLTRQHEGTGLGLAISRRLANLLHGEIYVESEPAKGSTFSVMLPLHGVNP